jgi:hypothetical protein
MMSNPPLRYPPQYFSGICRCGHAFEEHRLGFILNEKSRKQTLEDVLQRLGRFEFSSGGPRRVED